MEVFTDDWAAACCSGLNARGKFRELGRKWNQPVALRMRSEATLGVYADRVVFLDLAAGECRTARLASDEDLKAARFILAAEARQWKRLLEGELEPIPAVMTGRLKLERGSLAALMPHAALAREIMDAAREVGGHFPAEL